MLERILFILLDNIRSVFPHERVFMYVGNIGCFAKHRFFGLQKLKGSAGIRNGERQQMTGVSEMPILKSEIHNSILKSIRSITQKSKFYRRAVSRFLYIECFKRNVSENANGSYEKTNNTRVKICV